MCVSTSVIVCHIYISLMCTYSVNFPCSIFFNNLVLFLSSFYNTLLFLSFYGVIVTIGIPLIIHVQFGWI